MHDASERLRRFMSDLPEPSQAKLAELLGASQVSVSAWLGRRKRPGLRFALAIEALTGIKPAAWQKLKTPAQGKAA